MNIFLLSYMLIISGCIDDLTNKVKEIVKRDTPNDILKTHYSRYCDYDNGVICYAGRSTHEFSCVRKVRPICAKK